MGIEDPTAPPRSNCVSELPLIGLVLGVDQRERTDMTAATDLGQPVAVSDDVDTQVVSNLGNRPRIAHRDENKPKKAKC